MALETQQSQMGLETRQNILQKVGPDIAGMYDNLGKGREAAMLVGSLLPLNTPDGETAKAQLDLDLSSFDAMQKNVTDLVGKFQPLQNRFSKARGTLLKALSASKPDQKMQAVAACKKSSRIKNVYDEVVAEVAIYKAGGPNKVNTTTLSKCEDVPKYQHLLSLAAGGRQATDQADETFLASCKQHVNELQAAMVTVTQCAREVGALSGTIEEKKLVKKFLEETQKSDKVDADTKAKLVNQSIEEANAAKKAEADASTESKVQIFGLTLASWRTPNQSAVHKVKVMQDIENKMKAEQGSAANKQQQTEAAIAEAAKQCADAEAALPIAQQKLTNAESSLAAAQKVVEQDEKGKVDLATKFPAMKPSSLVALDSAIRAMTGQQSDLNMFDAFKSRAVQMLQDLADEILECKEQMEILEVDSWEVAILMLTPDEEQ